MRITLTGASGFLGTLLRDALLNEGHEILALVRKPPSQKDEVSWNPSRREIDTGGLEGTDAVIHLSGENIGMKRWTKRKKERIYSSRVESTRFLCEVLSALSSPPAILLSASAVGIYGNRGDEILTEASAPGVGFLANLAQDWEASTNPARERGIRVVHLRFGIVLSPKGGALPLLLKIHKWFLGGRLGSGNQWISWIAGEDVIAIVRFLLKSPDISGPVNVVSPEPIRQKELCSLLSKITKRSAFMHIPTPLLRLLLGEIATEVFLSSQRVYPRVLLDAGYRFLFPDLPSALAKLTGS